MSQVLSSFIYNIHSLQKFGMSSSYHHVKYFLNEEMFLPSEILSKFPKHVSSCLSSENKICIKEI